MTEQAKTNWQRFRENVALTADMIQIVTAAAIVAGVVSVLIGLVNVTVALVVALIALVISIAANLYLLRRRSRLLAHNAQLKRMSDTWADMLQKNLEHDIEMAKPRQPEPTEWLPDVKNLDSLAITTAELDRIYVRAEAQARDEVAPDATVEFRSVALLPFQCVYFDAYSTSSRVAAIVYVTPDNAWTSDLKRQHNTIVHGLPPWRIDTAWRELVRMSWLRERHMGEGVGLYWGNTPFSEGHESGWLICYRRKSGEITEDPRCYTLRDGVLYLKQS